MRYIIRPRAEHWTDDFGDVPDQPEISVDYDGRSYDETGLYDNHGNPLVKTRERIGY